MSNSVISPLVPNIFHLKYTSWGVWQVRRIREFIRVVIVACETSVCQLHLVVAGADEVDVDVVVGRMPGRSRCPRPCLASCRVADQIRKEEDVGHEETYDGGRLELGCVVGEPGERCLSCW